MTFSDWWQKNAEQATYEDAWNASRKAAWEEVFQIVSDDCDQFSREVIKKLEAARNAEL